MQGWQRAASNLCGVDSECINNHTQCFSTKSCAPVANCCLMRGDYLSPEWIDNNARTFGSIHLSIPIFISGILTLDDRGFCYGPQSGCQDLTRWTRWCFVGNLFGDWIGAIWQREGIKIMFGMLPFCERNASNKAPKAFVLQWTILQFEKFFLIFNTMCNCACQKFRCTEIAETWVGSEFVLLKEFYMTGHNARCKRNPILRLYLKSRLNVRADTVT